MTRLLVALALTPAVASVSSIGVMGIGVMGLWGIAPAFAQSGVSVDVSDSLYGTSSSTIRDLLRSSRRQTANGELEAAGITLERALAIQSDNPVLWNALARLRYRQGGYREVQSLAVRSESLAGNNRTLILRNRQLSLASEQALTGVVVPIGDLDLQTPDDALVATPSTSAGGHSITNQPSTQARVLNYESLPGPGNSEAYSAQQPQVSGPVVSAPASPSSRSTAVVVQAQPGDQGQPGSRAVGVTPAPRVTARPQWNNQHVVVRPAVEPGWNSQPTANQPIANQPIANQPITNQPTTNQASTNHQVVVTPTPQPAVTQTPSAPAVASNNGIEERSFNHYGRGGRGVPRQYLPPAGMCRIWFDDRAASEQPASGQCAALRRNVPAGSRLIVGEHRYSWDPFRKRY